MNGILICIAFLLCVVSQIMLNSKIHATYLLMFCPIHRRRPKFAQKRLHNMECNSFRSQVSVYGKYLIDHFIGQCFWNSGHTGKAADEIGLLFTT